MMWMLNNFQNNMNLNFFFMIKLNNMINLILLLLILMILYMINFLIINKFFNKVMFENQNMELIWTILPIILILMISLSSIKILFLNQEKKNNLISIKIISNQWFWFYEYMNLNKKFNSYLYMKKNFNFNIMETDNKLIIPFNYEISIFITSLDVIHSWTIPNLNIKIDSIPNQLNKKTFLINKPNLLFGQCSEICGINHSFMPINIESIKMNKFIKWINN